jgi:hypothetical protein
VIAYAGKTASSIRSVNSDHSFSHFSRRAARACLPDVPSG